MSLSTARSSIRAKEVGVRKVNGASRSSIAWQFYIEAAMYTVFSFMIGYIFCYFFKDRFFSILQLKMDTSFLYSPTVISIMFGLLIITTLIAGSYPSVVLSAYKPIANLKGKYNGEGGVTVRKVFTTFQFAISVGLIICGIIIERQLYYFRHKDTGVNRENVLIVPYKHTIGLGNKYLGFKHDISLLAGVSHVASARTPMYRYSDYIFTNTDAKNKSTVIFTMYVDKDFIPELNIKWKNPPASTNVLTTPLKIVINEAAINELKLKGNPVGQIINANAKYEIAGVIKDFNFNSMQQEIAPSAFFVVADQNLQYAFLDGFMYVKVKPGSNMPSLIAAIKNIYQKYDKITPFDYSFLDDNYNQQYKAEDRLSSIFSAFTVLTVLLAALGLFGLAAFTIEQRTKEIGIRKVLGASLFAIVTLLSADFLKLVLIAIIISTPLAWWAMHNWLQNFVYRISIEWWMFTAAGFAAIAVAVITVSYQSVKAALLNPVKNLRSE